MRVLNVILAGCLWLLAGCQSPRPAEVHRTKDDSTELKVPLETSINPDAGRGNLIIIKVGLKDGEEVSVVLDTGAGITCIDKSLTSKLGRPAGKITTRHWGKDSEHKLYAAPALYLDGARLRGGNTVVAMDFKVLSAMCGQPVAGILGMDVLENYCVQIDFAAHKLRFLDHSQGDQLAWGRAFPMMVLNDQDPRPAVAGNLLGEEGPHSLIDSGYDGGGWLMPKRYEQWTNQTTLSSATVHAPDGRFYGEAYPGLKLAREDVESDGLGVRFLARHLVTLDFPKQTLYLKRTSAGPLPDAGGTAVTFLHNLKERGQLPGWSKDEAGKPSGVNQEAGSNAMVVEVEKNGESSVYHYQVTRATEGDLWKLVKAWRTGAKGRVLEEYPVP